MKRPSSQKLSPKTVQRRLGWLVLLFIAAGSLSYPAPANWVIGQLSSITGIKIPEIQTPFVLGLDLQGGTSLEYEADVSKIAPADRSDAMSGVRDVIERRVNALGVSEPLVQTTQSGDSWRVSVELAGIRDINQAIKMIGETPILEFKVENDEKPRELTAEEKKMRDDKNTDAQKRAEAIFAEAKANPGNFEALAKEKTEDEAGKQNGGDLGFITQEMLSAAGGELDTIVAQAKLTPAGSVIEGVYPTTRAFNVVKVEEMKEEGSEVRAAHLLVTFEGSQSGIPTTSTKEQALAKIQALKQQATVENFERLVIENSDEPASDDTGGDLGYFEKGIMVEEFEKAVFAQATGTISDVVESPFGYHLIHKIDERPAKQVRLRVIAIKKTLDTDIVPPVDQWKATQLTGKQLERAVVDFDQQLGSAQVALQFNDEGAKLFQDMTRDNIGKPIAIFLDGTPISTPVVNQEIIGGRAVITGNFSVDEAKLLARRLQAGALPVPINLIAQQSVGPTLGADSLQKSIQAGLVAFALIAIFAILLYRIPGAAAVLVLVVYAALNAAVFKLVPITLTLSGIAGFILSIGMAIDSNVLVFERLKEELKDGRGLEAALEEAFKRAWTSIRDGHVTILISCAVLFWFSSSLIKGFALTLALGTVISLFTATFTTRTVLRVLAKTPLAKWPWLFLASGKK